MGGVTPLLNGFLIKNANALCLYIHSDNDQFYIGYSSDLRARITAHNEGQTKSTRGRIWKLVYYEAYLDEKSARHRERMLKHDGRTRRYLMERVKESVKNHLVAGEAPN